MKVPFVNYGLQYKKIKKEIDRAIEKCLRNGDLILRDEVEKFEKRFAKLCKAKYCLALNSGTDAIYLALKVIDYQLDGKLKGREVIVPWHVFEGVIEQIERVGALPYLVGVGYDFLMDIDEVEKIISSNVKVIMPVHLNGAVCDMKRIKELANMRNQYIIEDSCQAIGKPLEGDIACYSFYPAKILGCYGDGGALVTNNEFFYEKAKRLRDIGHLNSRLDNIQAAVLNVKLKYLPFYLKKRKEIAQMYLEGLKDLEVVGELILPKSRYWQNFVLYIKDTEKRDKLKEFLERKGIETMIKGHWYDEKWLKDRVLSLPLYPELTNKQINYVIKTIKEFFKKEDIGNWCSGFNWKSFDSTDSTTATTPVGSIGY